MIFALRRPRLRLSVPNLEGLKNGQKRIMHIPRFPKSLIGKKYTPYGVHTAERFVVFASRLQSFLLNRPNRSFEYDDRDLEFTKFKFWLQILALWTPSFDALRTLTTQ